MCLRVPNCFLSDAVQVGRATPGLPGCEFSSRRHVASSYTRGRACARTIDGCTHYASVYVCLYSCLSPAVQVGRTTPGRPRGEFSKRRQAAISHAWGRACSITQGRTHTLLYTFCICSHVPVFLPGPHHASRSHHARPTRGRDPEPAASGDLSLLGSGVCYFPTPRICCCTPSASVYVCLYSCLSPAMHASRTTPG